MPIALKEMSHRFVARYTPPVGDPEATVDLPVTLDAATCSVFSTGGADAEQARDALHRHLGILGIFLGPWTMVDHGHYLATRAPSPFKGLDRLTRSEDPPGS